MKLIIQIPCLNEEQTLPLTVADLPRAVDGFDVVEYLVVDDGSTDRTAAVAEACGVHHVVRLDCNRGLAHAFMVGIEESLRRGADVIVNTDADNQYRGEDVKALVAPIVARQAQIVIGARPIAEIETFSPIKKLLQRLGSRVVQWASSAAIPDAPSGFRAYHRDAALRLHVINSYTYTLETIIQAGRNNVPMMAVPVRVNGPTRPSRLFRSIPQYIARSAGTILRIFIVYQPLRFFAGLSAVVALPGIFGVARFLYFYLTDGGQGHVQSLVVSGALLAISVVLLAVGLLADLIAANRRLLEDIRTRQLSQMMKPAAPAVEARRSRKVLELQ